MSTVLFSIVYLAGAGLLAGWVDIRFPGARPQTWSRTGLAVVAAMAADDLCKRGLHIGPAIVGVMCVALPVLAGTFLVCIWLLRMLRGAMPAR